MRIKSASRAEEVCALEQNGDVVPCGRMSKRFVCGTFQTGMRSVDVSVSMFEDMISFSLFLLEIEVMRRFLHSHCYFAPTLFSHPSHLVVTASFTSLHVL